MNTPEDAIKYIWEHSDEYAKAKAGRVYLEQFRKSKKAMLVQEAETKGLKTAQERESYAYAHAEYLEVLKGLEAAVQVEESLRFKMEAVKIRVEIWRTKQSTKRAEMNLAPLQR